MGVNLGVNSFTHKLHPKLTAMSYKLSFSLEKRTNKMDCDLPIRLRFSFNGKRLEFYTGYRIAIDKWDEVEQEVKKGCINTERQTAGHINRQLKRIADTAIKIYEKSD